MENGIYYKDGVTRILDLMKETFGDYFKAYFNGEPEMLPESVLPCLIVTETTGAIESGATGTDNITETVTIIAVENKKDDVGSDVADNLTEYRLRKIVKGQYPEGHEKAGQYINPSIMYAIRTYITMSDSVLESRIETKFDVNMISEETMTQEAYVTVTMRRLALVPARS